MQQQGRLLEFWFGLTNVRANKKLVGHQLTLIRHYKLYYITCTVVVRSYANSTSIEATNQLLAS